MSFLDSLRHVKHQISGSNAKPVDRPDPVRQEIAEFGRRNAAYDIELSWSEATARFVDANDLYRYLHHYFHHRCPAIVREHRRYFSTGRRGYGEDAMHAMWWLLLLEAQPVCCLEIGVYRGQVLSLWALIAKHLHRPCKVFGVSPLRNLGDSVSFSYVPLPDYRADIEINFSHFALSEPTLCRSLSTDVEAADLLRSRPWDVVYIDGSHDFEVVLADYHLCKEHLSPTGILVLDDAALGTPFRPPAFAFAGHPGPSKVAKEFAMREMDFVGAVGHNLVFRKKDRPTQ